MKKCEWLEATPENLRKYEFHLLALFPSKCLGYWIDIADPWCFYGPDCLPGGPNPEKMPTHFFVLPQEPKVAA